VFVKTTVRKRGDKTYTYLSLVESVRVEGKMVHNTLLRLGEVSELRESGQLDRIIGALRAHAEKTWVSVVGGQVLVSSRVQRDMSVEPVDRSVLGPTSLRSHVVLEPIARTVDGDHLEVVKEAVQDRRGSIVVGPGLWDRRSWGVPSCRGDRLLGLTVTARTYVRSLWSGDFRRW